MNAGAFIHRLEFIGTERTTSASGFVKEKPITLFKARGWLKSLRQVYDKDGVMASESFYGSTLRFVVRDDRRLPQVRWVRWQDQLYTIRLIEPQPDRTSVLYLNRKDE